MPDSFISKLLVNENQFTFSVPEGAEITEIEVDDALDIEVSLLDDDEDVFGFADEVAAEEAVDN